MIHYDYQSVSQGIYAAELNEYPIAHVNALDIPVHLKGQYTRSMLMDDIVPFTTYAGARVVLVWEH